MRIFGQKPKFIKRLSRGDTIVEVLIAITVAAFAIGTAYAIANKSLQRAIIARERNQAVTMIQNQITDLKIRYKGDSNFLGRFALAAGTPARPEGYSHFCLDDTATGFTQTNWLKFDNDFVGNEARAEILATSPTGFYNPKCKITTTAADFYVDISALITNSSANSFYPTVYKVTVRWAQPGDGKTATSTVYYRIGGAISTTPVSCTQHYYDTVLTIDNSLTMQSPFTSDPTGRSKLLIAKDAAKQLVDNSGLTPTGNSNQMGLVQMTSAPTGPPGPGNAITLQNLTTDATALRNSINGIPTITGTFYIATMQRAGQILAASTSPTRDRVIIFLSDGEPDDDGYPPPTNPNAFGNIYAEATRLKNLGYVIYTIGIDIHNIPNPLTPTQEILTRMAGNRDSQGNLGRFFDVTEPDALEDVMLAIAGNMTCI